MKKMNNVFAVAATAVMAVCILTGRGEKAETGRGGKADDTYSATQYENNIELSADNNSDDIIQEVNGKKVFNMSTGEFFDIWNKSSITNKIADENINEWIENGTLPELTDAVTPMLPAKQSDCYYWGYWLRRGFVDKTPVLIFGNYKTSSHNIASIKYRDGMYYKENPHTTDCFALAIAIITRDNSSNFENSRKLVKEIIENKRYIKDGIYYLYKYDEDIGISFFMRPAEEND